MGKRMIQGREVSDVEARAWATEMEAEDDTDETWVGEPFGAEHTPRGATTQHHGIQLDDLLTLERAGWESLCASRGGSFYGELMTADGLFVLVNGMVLTRDEVAASLDGAPAWASFEITEPRAVAIGRDAASLVYRSASTRPGEEPFVALMSSTYRRVDGRLRLALYQQTPVPAT